MVISTEILKLQAIVVLRVVTIYINILFRLAAQTVFSQK